MYSVTYTRPQMKQISCYSVYVCFLLFCVAASEIAGKLSHGKQNDKHQIRKEGTHAFLKSRTVQQASTLPRLRDENITSTADSFAPANTSNDDPIGTSNDTQPSINEIIDNHSTENNTGGFTNEINDSQTHDSGETDNNGSNEGNGSNSGENSGEVCPPMKKCYCGPTVLPQRNHTDNGNHYGQYSLQPSQNNGEINVQDDHESQLVSTTEGYISAK